MTPDVAHPQDDRIRSLSGIDDAVLAGRLDPALRDALLESIVAEPLVEHSWRRNNRRLAVALGVAGVLVASSAAAVAREVWQREHPGQAVEVDCLQGTDAEHAERADDGGVPASTGDPITDCAAAWKQQRGEDAPELVAYTNDAGGVVVQPKDWAMPAGWKPLAADFQLDSALVELDHALQDEIRGLSARCLSATEGRALAEGTLARLGLTDWKAEIPGRPDGERSCVQYSFGANPERKALELGEGEPPSAQGLRFEEMAAALRKTPECQTHDQALAAVRRAAEEAGIPEGIEGYVLTEPFATSRADSECVRIVMLVAGGMNIELWG